MEQTTSNNMGHIITESYKGKSDHPEFMSYLRGEHGDGVGVITGQIMQRWVEELIISEGYACCFPIIAINDEKKAQMIHVSRDPWRPTNTDDYLQKLNEWKDNGCDVCMLRTTKSAVGNDENMMLEMFGDKFMSINLDTDSRFGVIVDVKQRLLIVQLTDLKELKKYNI